MKCSSRRNCDPARSRWPRPSACRLNEVQFPKELRLGGPDGDFDPAEPQRSAVPEGTATPGGLTPLRSCISLNEVQFPKELRPRVRGSRIPNNGPQ